MIHHTTFAITTVHGRHYEANFTINPPTTWSGRTFALLVVSVWLMIQTAAAVLVMPLMRTAGPPRAPEPAPAPSVPDESEPTFGEVEPELDPLRRPTAPM